MDYLSSALRACGLTVTLVDTIQRRYMDIYCNLRQGIELDQSESEEDESD